MKPIKSLALIGILTSIHQTAFAEMPVAASMSNTTSIMRTMGTIDAVIGDNMITFSRTSTLNTSTLNTLNPTPAKVITVLCQIGGGDLCDEVGSAVSIATVGGTAAAVTGASGASIMSTMGAAGAVVGGGVVAGVGLVGGFGGVGAAHLMNKHLYSDCKDQKACDAAQFGTYTGAAVGTAASVGALAVAGAGPVGLASIGATVGGGMAAGATAVVAAPVVAAVAIGGLVYWLFK